MKKDPTVIERTLLILALFGSSLSGAVVAGEPAGVRRSDWNGFERLDFTVAARPCLLVLPKAPAEGKPWIWRTEFFGHEPQADLALLARGFHVAYLDVQNMYGAPVALDHMDTFHEHLVREYKLAPQAVLEGFSRGGLFSLNWAARNPAKVACIYNDAPVCDFKSWPAGKGKGKGSPADWERCLAVYGLNESQALEYKLNPVDHLAPLAKAGIPLLHVCGTADDVVPFDENTGILAERYRALGGPITVIAKAGVGHHPHSLPNPYPIVAFVLQHTAVKSPETLLMNSRRIVFLGDSITAAGPYVAYFDAWLTSLRLDQLPQVIDAGLPSETVSGLSEEGHAGGQFPRPDLAERLDRVLALTKPDLVVACYGINCGIYEPFDKGRFERYQRGMTQLKLKAEKAGAKFVAVTPPFYDDLRAPRPFSYNEVLDRYSDWLIGQRPAGWQIVDLHGPMTREVQKRRQADPQFTFQPDGVHPNDEGYWFVARQLIQWFGDEKRSAAANPKDMLALQGIPEALLPLVQQRVSVLRDAYVGTAGHKRPGVAAGLPVPEAEKQAAELSAKIRQVLAEGK